MYQYSISSYNCMLSANMHNKVLCTGHLGLYQVVSVQCNFQFALSVQYKPIAHIKCGECINVV